MIQGGVNVVSKIVEIWGTASPELGSRTPNITPLFGFGLPKFVALHLV